MGLSQDLNSKNKIDSQSYEYAVYSYNTHTSEKKGQCWRQHGTFDTQDEAFWIAEQLKACQTIDRIEICLQGLNPKTKTPHNKRIKTISKTPTGFIEKMRNLFS